MMYIRQFAPNIVQTARVLKLFVRLEWRCARRLFLELSSS